MDFRYLSLRSGQVTRCCLLDQSSYQGSSQAFYPKLPLQASRPTGAGLPCWTCGDRAAPLLPTLSLSSSSLPPASPLFPCFMAGIWKPFLFIHSTRMLPLAVLQQAESSYSLQGHFRGCMRSSQLFAGSAWARYFSVRGGMAICARGSSWAVSVSGLEAVRVPPKSGWLFSGLLLSSPCLSVLP